jgi:hypothetical protein
MVPLLRPSTTLEYSERCLSKIGSDMCCAIDDTRKNSQRINARQTRAGTIHKREAFRHTINPRQEATISNNTSVIRREKDNRTQRNSGIKYVKRLRMNWLMPTGTITQHMILITAPPCVTRR